MAARRVADENRQLRELLYKAGFGDEYIVQYMQTYPVAPQGSTAASPHTVSPAVQSMQHLLAARRPASLDSNMPFSMLNQASSREASITSVSTSNSSSIWETAQGSMPTIYAHSPTMSVPTTMTGPPGPPQDAHVGFPESSIPRTELFPVPVSEAMLEEQRRHLYASQILPADHGQAYHHALPSNAYHGPPPGS